VWWSKTSEMHDCLYIGKRCAVWVLRHGRDVHPMWVESTTGNVAIRIWSEFWFLSWSREVQLLSFWWWVAPPKTQCLCEESLKWKGWGMVLRYHLAYAWFRLGTLWGQYGTLAISTGLCLDSTWAGQSLDTNWTLVTRVATTWTARQMTQGHTKGRSLV